MKIQPIQIKKGDRRTTFKSILSYGRSRVGKTRFAGTFPRPRFLSEASERGWTTLETMPEDYFYEPARPPEVWPIEDSQQMAEALHETKKDVFAGKVLSVVIDSLTFYSDNYFAWMHAQAAKTAGSKGIDTRALYSALTAHLLGLRTEIHKWPCNVVWLCLEKPPEGDNPQGGPMLTGQTAQKFPAGCDHVFYHRAYSGQVVGEDGKTYVERQFEARTSPWGQYLAGGRDSGMLPDPFPDPTYRAFAEYLEIPDPLAAPRPAPKPTPVPTTVRRVVAPATKPS